MGQFSTFMGLKWPDLAPLGGKMRQKRPQNLQEWEQELLRRQQAVNDLLSLGPIEHLSEPQMNKLGAETLLKYIAKAHIKHLKRDNKGGKI